MGREVIVVCGECDNEFSAIIGPMRLGTPTRCRECGEEGPMVMVGEDGVDVAPPGERLDCSCGGRFASDAPHRCPTCHRAFTESELELLDEGPGLLLD